MTWYGDAEQADDGVTWYGDAEQADGRW